MQEKKVVLKPGREKALEVRHPWIFSGAVASFPSFENGEILPVYSASGRCLAQAYFHRNNSIAGRILTFQEETVKEAIERHFSAAIALRHTLFDKNHTNAFRLVNAEGDNLPGLIIDIYDDIAVLQINTCGMERLRGDIIALMRVKLKLRGIYEKSQSQARLQEGLQERTGLVWGECPSDALFKEHGMLFIASLEKGQKTGFFLDQREMRQLIFRFAAGRRVLNCFAYSGGFSLFALKGGARHVVSVDSSQEACRQCRENTRMNHLDPVLHEIIQEDVFTYLRKEALPYDLVILDPPAFAKHRHDVINACRGYKEINRLVLEKIPPHSFLLTSSCSHFVDEKLFQQLIFQAALEAKRQVAVCSSHLQTPDHPVSLYHPEGKYLKSLFLHVI